MIFQLLIHPTKHSKMMHLFQNYAMWECDSRQSNPIWATAYPLFRLPAYILCGIEFWPQKIPTYICFVVFIALLCLLICLCAPPEIFILLYSEINVWERILLNIACITRESVTMTITGKVAYVMLSKGWWSKTSGVMKLWAGSWSSLHGWAQHWLTHRSYSWTSSVCKVRKTCFF